MSEFLYWSVLRLSQRFAVAKRSMFESTTWLVGWLVGRSVGWLVGWSVGRSVGWLIIILVVC